MLSAHSQRTNRKVREVATAMVERVGRVRKSGAQEWTDTVAPGDLAARRDLRLNANTPQPWR